MTEGGHFIPQEKMLVSSTSPVSDAAVIRMTENTMGESALVLIQPHDSSSIWVFRTSVDEVIGPVLTSNQLSRNANITMANNKFGRLHHCLPS